MRTRERSVRPAVLVSQTRVSLRACGYALVCLAALPGSLPGQLPPGPSSHTAPNKSLLSGELAVKLQQRGDLTLSDTTLRQALFMISDAWGVNLVVGQSVDGVVNGVFKNAPLHEVLDAILYANGFGYRVVGQGLVVMPRANLNDVNPLFQTATIALRGIDPQDLIESAKLLSSPQGKLEVIASARALLVIDLPENVQRIRAFVAELESSAAGSAIDAPAVQQLELAHFAPQYISALDIRESVETLLSESGKAAVVESENRLVVVDFPSRLQLVEQMVIKLDTPRPQVRITALIYDISLEDLEELGINWSHAAKARYNGSEPTRVFSLDSVLTVPATVGNPGSVMTLMNLSRHLDLTAVVDALSSCDRSRLLADPTVTVMDREEATISIVTEIPFQQLTQTQEGGAIGTTDFKEAGVVLTVTPQIAHDGTIRLNVTPTFSRLAGFTGGPEPQPIINKREARTSVRVADRQTLIIGGLKQRINIDERDGVPYLKDIQFLHIGKLFRGSGVRSEESELVVFITPEIVSPVDRGVPREQIAYQVGRNQLDRNFVARETCCGNPFCCRHGVPNYPLPSHGGPRSPARPGPEVELLPGPLSSDDLRVPEPDFPPRLTEPDESRSRHPQPSSRRTARSHHRELYRLAPVSQPPQQECEFVCLPELPRKPASKGPTQRRKETRRIALPGWMDELFRR